MICLHVKRGVSTSIKLQGEGHRPWIGFNFCSSARSLVASSHSRVSVLGGGGAKVQGYKYESANAREKTDLASGWPG
jgi:hypothetical protein